MTGGECHTRRRQLEMEADSVACTLTDGSLPDTAWVDGQGWSVGSGLPATPCPGQVWKEGKIIRLLRQSSMTK